MIFMCTRQLGGGGGVMSKPWLNWVIRAGVGMHGVVDN